MAYSLSLTIKATTEHFGFFGQVSEAKSWGLLGRTCTLLAISSVASVFSILSLIREQEIYGS